MLPSERVKKYWSTGVLYLMNILLVAGISSCQEESVQIAPIPPEQAITIDAPVAQLLQRLVMLDGSGDNILDKGSCSSVTFPVSIVVNGQSMVIQSSDDLDEIEHIFDQSDLDDDSVAIQFPITVTLPDYTTKTIINQEEFEQLVATCTEGGSDDDIECLDLSYPVSVAIYDTSNQQSDVLIMNSDKDVYQFLDQVSNAVLIGLQFPVTFVDSAGVEISIANYDQMEELLLSNSDCDEDDDNDYDEDDLDTSEMQSLITSGNWAVESYLDETDQTFLFTGYTFSFQPDGTSAATKAGNPQPGTWAVYGDSGALEWKIAFESGDPVDELNEDWEVGVFTNETIELFDKPGDPETRRLVFRKQ